MKHIGVIAIAVFAAILPDSAVAQRAPAEGYEGKAVSRLPVQLQRSLDAALVREERAKKIGLYLPSFPMPFRFDGKYGALNRDGTYAVSPTYDWMDDFSEGRAVVGLQDRFTTLYGYVDESGGVIWPPNFAVADRFSRGLAQVEVDGASGLIDREGKVVLWPRFGFVVPFTKDLFWVTEEREIVQGKSGQTRFLFDQPISSLNGISDTSIKPKGRWGLVDRSGSWVRQPEFSAVRIFSKDDLGLMWARTSAGWGLIRTDLSWQVEPQFDQAGYLSENRAVVVLNKRWGFVDETGRVVIEPRFDYSFPFSGRYAPARVNKQFGLIDRTGAWVVEPTYEMIYPGGYLTPRSWWTVVAGKKYGLLDDTLRVAITPQLDQTPAVCTDGQIMGVIDKKWRLFSRDGAPVQGEGERCDSAK